MATTILSPHVQRETEYWAEVMTFLGLYAESDANAVFDIIAATPGRKLQVVNRMAKLYGFDGINSADWREWMDKRVVNYLTSVSFEVKCRPYEYTEALDDEAEMFGNVLVQPLQRTQPILDGFFRWRTKLCLDAIFDPAATSIDDQMMFDAEHAHLDQKRGTYSNIVAGPGRVEAAKPSTEEVSNEFEAGIDRLDMNRVFGDDAEIVPGTATANRRYVVITRDLATRSAYRRLLTRSHLDDNGTRVENPYRNGFTLIHKSGGAAPQPYAIVRADQNGPRPVMWAPWKDPDGLKFKKKEELQDTPDVDLVYGMSAWGGPRSAFAETVVRLDP